MPERTLRQYNPSRSSPQHAPAASGRATAADAERTATHRRVLSVDVRLVFERGGFCRLSLLPRRDGTFPSVLEPSGLGAPGEFIELQDDWYQDIFGDDISERLREGVEWQAQLPDDSFVNWSLAGRKLYVLAANSELSGFVDATRLTIGEDQVVICVAKCFDEVLAAILATQSPPPTILDQSRGMPLGWLALAGIRPKVSAPRSQDGDWLDVLRPLPEASIVLEGGIRLQRQVWLEGHPPRIRISGDASLIGELTIDGKRVEPNSDGTCECAGWDARGTHTIWCTTQTRSYTIREGAETWDGWSAYSWSLGEFDSSDSVGSPSICGAAVFASDAAGAKHLPFYVRSSNSILLGSRPGQVHVCRARSDIRSPLAVGFPDFDPVWAVPANPARRSKASERILLVGSPTPVAHVETLRPANRRAAAARSKMISNWCSALRAASSKSLRVASADPAIRSLWRSYRKQAKAIARSLP